MVDLQDIQKYLDIYFNDILLLQQALTHTSFVNENPSAGTSDNERLEFLGDAVLGFVIAEILYKRFSELSEGQLTEMRVAMVRRETLAKLADELDIGNYLYMGRGEETSGGRSRPNNLANALEALIGSIFIDSGLEKARQWILRIYKEQLDNAAFSKPDKNYKALLQELIQAEHKSLPEYRLIATTGPAHDQDFQVEVVLNNKSLGEGQGKTKRAAEMEAAHNALENLSRQE